MIETVTVTVTVTAIEIEIRVVIATDTAAEGTQMRMNAITSGKGIQRRATDRDMAIAAGTDQMNQDAIAEGRTRKT